MPYRLGPCTPRMTDASLAPMCGSTSLTSSFHASLLTATRAASSLNSSSRDATVGASRRTRVRVCLRVMTPSLLRSFVGQSPMIARLWPTRRKQWIGHINRRPTRQRRHIKRWGPYPRHRLIIRHEHDQDPRLVLQVRRLRIARLIPIPAVILQPATLHEGVPE